MCLVVRALSRTKAEHGGSECGWAFYFEGLVRKASLTMCRYRVQAAKQRTRHQNRDGLGLGAGEGQGTLQMTNMPGKELVTILFPSSDRGSARNFDTRCWPVKTDPDSVTGLSQGSGRKLVCIPEGLMFGVEQL